MIGHATKFLCLSIVFFISSFNALFAEELKRIELEEKEYGYIVSSTIWPRGSFPLNICWENIEEKYKKQASDVKKVIEDTWDRYSGVSFKGWEKCPVNFIGIRILISDEHPHVKTLGKRLDGLKNGMILNFDFDEKFKTCKSNETMYDLCIKSIAVHEFGHALGFEHEQNRGDRDRSCLEPKDSFDEGDVYLTPYDPDSVMNYCNPKYNNFGKLSYYDILSIQKLYGMPEQ